VHRLSAQGARHARRQVVRSNAVAGGAEERPADELERSTAVGRAEIVMEGVVSAHIAPFGRPAQKEVEPLSGASAATAAAAARMEAPLGGLLRYLAVVFRSTPPFLRSGALYRPLNLDEEELKRLISVTTAGSGALRASRSARYFDVFSPLLR